MSRLADYLRLTMLALIWALGSGSIAAGEWTLTSKVGDFRGFQVDNNTIYLAERVCADINDCAVTRILHLDLTGRVLDSVQVPLLLFSASFGKNVILLGGVEDSSEYFDTYMVLDKKWNVLDTVPSGMTAFLLSDSLIFYGEDCSDEEGQYSDTLVPKEVYLRDPAKRVTYVVSLNAEAIDARLVRNTLFIIGRSGPVSGPVYKLYSADPRIPGSTREIGNLSGGPTGEIYTHWFVNDSLLVFLNDVCTYGDTLCACQTLKSVRLDTLMIGGIDYLGHRLISTDSSILEVLWPAGPDDIDGYKMFITKVLTGKGPYLHSNPSVWTSDTSERCFFALTNTGHNATFGVLKK